MYCVYVHLIITFHPPLAGGEEEAARKRAEEEEASLALAQRLQREEEEEWARQNEANRILRQVRERAQAHISPPPPPTDLPSVIPGNVVGIW